MSQTIKTRNIQTQGQPVCVTVPGQDSWRNQPRFCLTFWCIFFGGGVGCRVPAEERLEVGNTNPGVQFYFLDSLGLWLEAKCSFSLSLLYSQSENVDRWFVHPKWDSVNSQVPSAFMIIQKVYLKRRDESEYVLSGPYLLILTFEKNCI